MEQAGAEMGLSLGGLNVRVVSSPALPAWPAAEAALAPFQAVAGKAPDLTLRIVPQPAAQAAWAGSPEHDVQQVAAYFQSLYRRAWPSEEGQPSLLDNMLSRVAGCLDIPEFRDALDAFFLDPERFSLFALPDPDLGYAAVLDRRTGEARVFVPRDWDSGSEKRTIQLVSSSLRYALAMMLHRFDGVLFHAASVERAGEACLFVGHSGTGKSTLLRTRPAGYSALADDGVIVRTVGGRFVTYATPWNAINGATGLAGWTGASGAGEVKAVFFLDRGSGAEPVPETEAGAVGLALRQMNPFLWWLDAAGQQAAWGLLQGLFRGAPAFRLDALAGCDTWSLVQQILVHKSWRSHDEKQRV